MTHRAFPGLARNGAGDLLITYREAAGHGTLTGANRGVVRMKKSTDDGATWGAAVTILDDSSEQRDARDPSMLTLSDGTIICTGFFGNTDNNDDTAWCIRSTDDGDTWSSPANIPATTRDPRAAGMPIELPNGDVLQALYGRFGSPAQGLFSATVAKSTDSGATWSELSTIVTGSTFSYFEPSLALLSDGSVLCVLRRSDSPGVPRVLLWSKSEDSGATWSASAELFQGTGRPALINAGGRLVCAYRAADDDGSEGPENYWRESLDDGATWGDPKLISTAPGSGRWTYGQFVADSPAVLAYVYAEESSASSSVVSFTYLQRDGVSRL